MEIEHSKIHDIIVKAKKVEPLSEKEYRYKTPSREVVLGMKFDRGEAVIDRITGEGGEVIGGIKEAVVTG
uniref:Uncharacterized protein n=1 Tax=viral metagenome TaxID=1070528 RepID=A0A6H2A1X2_9ZZZZ